MSEVHPKKENTFFLRVVCFADIKIHVDKMWHFFKKQQRIEKEGEEWNQNKSLQEMRVSHYLSNSWFLIYDIVNATELFRRR